MSTRGRPTSQAAAFVLVTRVWLCRPGHPFARRVCFDSAGALVDKGRVGGQARQPCMAIDTVDLVPAGSSRFWVFVGCTMCLVCTGGIMSGLTVGMYSLEEIDLKTHEKGGKRARRQCRWIRYALRKQNRLLCTLLIVNTTANMALPMFLEAIVPPWASLLLSVSAVLLFGEVLPQALCIGPRKVVIIAWLAPLVRLLLFVIYPVAKPISMLLDRALGKGTPQTAPESRSPQAPRPPPTTSRTNDDAAPVSPGSDHSQRWARLLDRAVYELHGARSYEIQILPLNGAPHRISGEAAPPNVGDASELTECEKGVQQLGDFGAKAAGRAAEEPSDDVAALRSAIGEGGNKHRRCHGSALLAEANPVPSDAPMFAL